MFRKKKNDRPICIPRKNKVKKNSEPNACFHPVPIAFPSRSHPVDFIPVSFSFPKPIAQGSSFRNSRKGRKSRNNRKDSKQKVQENTKSTP